MCVHTIKIACFFPMFSINKLRREVKELMFYIVLPECKSRDTCTKLLIKANLNIHFVNDFVRIRRGG